MRFTKPLPERCPLCKKAMKSVLGEWGHEGYEQWITFAHHVRYNHCPASYRHDHDCLCGFYSKNWETSAKHLYDQDDLEIHLALAAIALVGADSV